MSEPPAPPPRVNIQKKNTFATIVSGINAGKADAGAVKKILMANIDPVKKGIRAAALKKEKQSLVRLSLSLTTQRP